MKGIFLLLGTNLGDRLANLNQAKFLLESYPVIIVDYSKIYESAPWGDTEQGSFLNIILRVDTILDPHQLLEVCLEVEKRMGRERIKKWGERIIDMDILYYDNHIINDEKLIIPHPGIQMRRFTLIPMVEVAPNEAHPLLGHSQLELLELCPDPLDCTITEMELEL